MKRLATILMAAAALTARADDRAMFVMAGDVARLVIIDVDGDMEWEQTVDFDHEGHIATIDGRTPTVERDELDRPVSITLTDEDEDGEPVSVTTRLTYLGDTFSVSRAETLDATDEGNTSFIFRYDPATGRTLSRTFAAMGEEQTFTYTYSASDLTGNWTERTERADGTDSSMTQRRRYELR